MIPVVEPKDSAEAPRAPRKHGLKQGQARLPTSPPNVSFRVALRPPRLTYRQFAILPPNSPQKKNSREVRNGELAPASTSVNDCAKLREWNRFVRRRRGTLRFDNCGLPDTMYP